MKERKKLAFFQRFLEGNSSNFANTYLTIINLKGVFMLHIKTAKIWDIIKIRKLRKKRSNGNFYSEYIGSLIYCIIKKDCYLIIEKSKIYGVVIVNDIKREVFYIPGNEDKISFPRLIYILKKDLKVLGYVLNLKYRKININNIKKYLPIKVIDNIKYMHIKISEQFKPNCGNNDNLKVRNAEVNKDEVNRVELQNKIFGNINGRKELTLEEVLNEQKGSKFLKDLCFVLEENNQPIGYGQIIIMDDSYYLVNFGIIPEFRGRGYSKYFLSNVIKKCQEYGIDDLYLSVDNANYNAVNLYKKIGFTEVYNKLIIEI